MKSESSRVHLVNPSHTSFGTAVITPRWLYVLAGATPRSYGEPILVDETLEQLDPNTIRAGDVVGIGIHTANALRGYEIGAMARERGAWVVFGGIHTTLYPDEAFERGGAHAVVLGDGDVVWSQVLAHCAAGAPQRRYHGGQIDADNFVPARWDLIAAVSAATSLAAIGWGLADDRPHGPLQAVQHRHEQLQCAPCVELSCRRRPFRDVRRRCPFHQQQHRQQPAGLEQLQHGHSGKCHPARLHQHQLQRQALHRRAGIRLSEPVSPA